MGATFDGATLEIVFFSMSNRFLGVDDISVYVSVCPCVCVCVCVCVRTATLLVTLRNLNPCHILYLELCLCKNLYVTLNGS